MSSHLSLLPGRPPAVLIARFVAESALEYPGVDGIDGRLHLWQQHRDCWVVAFLNRDPDGLACVAHIDAGRYAGETCLYWIEVLPEARRQGVGRALLRWTAAQAERLLIVATPGAAERFRLVAWGTPLAERCNDLLQGAKVLVEGRVQRCTADDPAEQARFAVEVRVRECLVIDPGDAAAMLVPASPRPPTSADAHDESIGCATLHRAAIACLRAAPSDARTPDRAATDDLDQNRQTIASSPHLMRQHLINAKGQVTYTDTGHGSLVTLPMLALADAPQAELLDTLFVGEEWITCQSPHG